MKKTLLIFGSEGFVGPYLTNEFFNVGYEVFGADVLSTSHHLDDIHYQQIDILNFDNVNDIIKRI